MSEFVPIVQPAPAPTSFHFVGWRFDARDGLLAGDDGEISLRPKTAGVLRELLLNAGEVVAKQRLLDTVWGDAGAGDDALAVCVNELRRALRDDPRDPRFIATAHRRGYRFVAPVVDVRAPHGTPTPTLVGRDRELEMLRAWWDAAGEPHRRVGVIAGELGIGKSALVRAFVDEVRAGGGAWIGEGHCLERFGDADPYHPLLEALNTLCAGPRGARAQEVISARAPSWARQLTGWVDDTRVAELRSRTTGPTRGRMLREFVSAMAELGAEAPVLLVCEDLHAGDLASIELISAISRRGAPSGLLMLATARSDAATMVSGSEWNVVDRLLAHGETGLLELGPLGSGDVRDLLATRLSGTVVDDDLADAVHARTGGSPLYLVMLADYLAAREAVGVDASSPDLGLPDSLRRVVERRIDALSPEDRRLLETASVAGTEFTAAAVAAVADAPAGERAVEERLSRLARAQHVLRELEPAAWPDGTVTARFGFRHSLHRDVLYDRLGGTRRIVAHRRIGTRLGTAFAERPGPSAAEIAGHFEHGHDAANAAVWFARAAETAMSRQVPVAALEHTDRGLGNLEQLRTMPHDDSAQWDPPTRSIALAEGRLRLIRVAASILVWGVRSDRVADEATLLERSAAAVDDPAALGRIAYVLWSVALMRGDVRSASDRLERLVSAAEMSRDDGMRLQAANAQAITTLARGAPERARAFLDRARAIDSPSTRRRLAGTYQDSGVLLRTFGALDEWLLGHESEARRAAHEALSLARAGSRPDGLCQALGALCAIHQLLGDTEKVRALAAELLDLAEANGFTLWVSAGRVMGGWARIGDDPFDAVDTIRSGLAEVETVADGIWGPYHLSLLAEAEASAGRIASALEVVDRALGVAETSGELWYVAELMRLRAGLLLADAAHESAAQRIGREREADALLARSLQTAREQGARVLEQRALATIAARTHAHP